MIALFFLAFLLLIAAEVVKGLSANGTPPVLQRLTWQLDLAWVMWRNILYIRVALLAALFFFAGRAWPDFGLGAALGTVVFGAVWYGVYHLFNRFWVGRVKFPPISQMVFEGKDENQVPGDIQVLGVDYNGQRLAVPLNMINFHHQMSVTVGGKPMWFTYCGLCRSGRVYDAVVDGRPLDFTLVGAITFNAVFQDNQTGSWWRQELGEAAKGPLAGQALTDIDFEQMSLDAWYEKYPDSTALQYDPKFLRPYNFAAKLLSYQTSWPAWARHESPPLVIGVEIGAEARGYDFGQLQSRGMVQDEVGGKPLLVAAESEGFTGFVYDRTVKGEALDFEPDDGGYKDTKTGSHWDKFGRCTQGDLKGEALERVQNYQQFVRSWIEFHSHTTFYSF